MQVLLHHFTFHKWKPMYLFFVIFLGTRWGSVAYRAACMRNIYWPREGKFDMEISANSVFGLFFTENSMKMEKNGLGACMPYAP